MRTVDNSVNSPSAWVVRSFEMRLAAPKRALALPNLAEADAPRASSRFRTRVTRRMADILAPQL